MIARFYVKTRRNNISETALPTKISKFQKHLSKSPQKPLSTTQKWFFGHFTYEKNFYVKFSLCPILPFGILMVLRALF